MSRRAPPALLLAFLSCAATEPVTLHTGMRFGDIERRILDQGGRRLENAYPVPWTSPDDQRAGYHVTFELRDGTCLQCRLESRPSAGTTESGYEVIRFEVGPRGRPYPGKLKWLDEGREHDYPMKLDLSDFLYFPPSKVPQ